MGIQNIKMIRKLLDQVEARKRSQESIGSPNSPYEQKNGPKAQLLLQRESMGGD